MAKKRSNKYENKLAINASFEDVIKIALGMKPNTQNMTSTELIKYYSELNSSQFKLNQENLVYPEQDYFLNSREFTFLKIKGTSNVGISITFLHLNGNSYSESLTPSFDTKVIMKDLKLVLLPCQIKIELNTNAGSKEPAYADISFSFSTTTL